MRRYAHDPSAAPRYTVDVFGSLRLANATFDATTNRYEQNAGTERVFLGGLARVLHDSSLPNVGSDRHVFLTVGDHLGSSSVILDADTSELVEQITYHAYGTVESDYRSPRWDSFREDLRFTGKEDEIELGLQYFGARYYSPNLGRFISPDPLTIHGAAGDINPYAYVRGRVYNMVDPLGLEGCDPSTGMCGGGLDTGHPGAGGIIDALNGLFGGDGSGRGGGALPTSNVYRGSLAKAASIVAKTYSPQAALATGAFNTTYPGLVINAATHPVDDRGEYFAGIGKGAVLGACIWCVLGASSAGYVPDEFYLAAASEDGQRGIADGFGLVGAAAGLGEFASLSAIESRGADGLLTAGRASYGPRFDPTKLARIVQNLEGTGKVSFEIGTQWAESVLNQASADGAYLARPQGGGGTIFLRANPSRAAVIEELLHFGQHRATGFAAGWPGAQLSQIEMAAQMKLLGIRSVRWTTPELYNLFGAWNFWRGGGLRW